MVSDKATTCPHCGAPLAKETAKDNSNPSYRQYYTIDEQPTLTFGEAIYSALIKNYVNFSGRARRSEYWYFSLFDVIVGIITYFTPSPTIEVWGQPVSLLYCLYCLVSFLPMLAVSVRRLHDIGKSGWNILTLYLISFLTIPIFVIFASSPFIVLGWTVGFIIFGIQMLIWLCRDSEEENDYGPSPKYKQVLQSKPTPKPTPSPTIAEDNSSYAPTANSSKPLRGMSGAHLEAMRAIQELKEQDDSKKEIVEEIKKTHQQFLAEQEKKESETEKEEKRPTPPAAPSSITDINPKKADTPTDTKQAVGKDSRKQIWQGILQAVGAYVVFLLCLLLLGSLFPQSKGLRYYANGFYAWFGWQPFEESPAFQQYPLIDLFGHNEKTDNAQSTRRSVETSNETNAMLLDEFNYEKSFDKRGSNGKEVNLGEFQCKLSYPKSIAGQDLHKLHAQIVEDCFGTKYAGLNFQQATLSFLKDEFQYDEDDIKLRIETNREWWADSKTIELTCSYDSKLNWVQYLIHATDSPHGAMHGTYSDTYKIFDMNKQRLLSYYDLFNVKKEVIQPILWNQLMAQYKDEDPDTFWDFYVSENISREEAADGIYYVFHYNPYAIAPFSFGVIDIKVPSSKLSNYLR